MRRTNALWAAVIFAAALRAQTTTAIVLNFPGLSLSGDTLSGNGTMAPFGSASIAATIAGAGNSSFVFTFGGGDKINAATTAFQGGVNGGSGTAQISGGTGIFDGATGSFSFIFVLSTQSNGFNFSGTGTAVLKTATGGPGGSGYPVAGPGGPGYPLGGDGGAQIVVCRNPSASNGVTHPDALAIADADCSQASSDSGINYYPIYDTSDANTSTQLAFWVSQQQLELEESLERNYRNLLIEIIQNVRGQASCGGCNTTPAATIAAGASTSGNTFNIVTPLQTAAATYTATANCPSSPADCWISVPKPNGSIAASSRAAITAVADPSGLSPGVYSGNVSVAIQSGSATPSIVTTPITVVVSPDQNLSLSHTGLLFQATAGSTALQSQSVVVSTDGPGSLPFAASPSTLSGGNWLSVSPGISSTDSSTPAVVNVEANPSGLAAGQYYGTVTVTAPGISDSPKSIDVVLTVGPASSAGPLISPGSLTFVEPASGNPSPQNVQFINVTGGTLSVSATPQFGTPTNWFTVTSSGSSVAAGQTLTETVQINAQGLAAGVYSGNLLLHVSQPGTDYFVPVLLIVPQGLSATASARPAAAGTILAGASCAPSELLPVFTNLPGGFKIAAGLPASVQVSVTDDCGVPLTSGQVTMYFPGSGDGDASMTPLGNGQWAATWLPHVPGGGDSEIAVVATEASPALVGSAGVRGTVTANSTTPIISPGGVVSAASVAAGGYLPVAPGEFISIFGSNIVTTPDIYTAATPYPSSLSYVQATLGGERMPLEVANPIQLNAVVPYDVPVGSVLQVTVTHSGSSQSAPEPVVIAAAQPTVFTQDQSGSGAGAILTLSGATGAVSLNMAAAPAHAGDVLEVYCTGLGAVTPAIAAGQAAPLDSYVQTVNTVTATIGGMTAKVEFAGLAPGFAGLYQVNVIVPQGVAAGPAVPLVLSEAGAVSPPVTVAIQ